MICEKCGTQIDDDSKFCLNCGASLDDDNIYQQSNRNVNQGYYSQNSQPPGVNYGNFVNRGNDGMDYRPISMWGYFGYNILFLIPLVGFILILVFSFGGTRNINLRNYARSQFCVWILVGIIILLLIIIGALFFSAGCYGFM